MWRDKTEKLDGCARGRCSSWCIKNVGMDVPMDTMVCSKVALKSLSSKVVLSG